jgi:hypothetical protein
VKITNVDSCLHLDGTALRITKEIAACQPFRYARSDIAYRVGRALKTGFALWEDGLNLVAIFKK